jgi:hypothetical protein
LEKYWRGWQIIGWVDWRAERRKPPGEIEVCSSLNFAHLDEQTSIRRNRWIIKNLRFSFLSLLIGEGCQGEFAKNVRTT